MTKAQEIEQYNKDNQRYNITGIKKLSTTDIEAYRVWGKSDIYELYKHPSLAKIDSWNNILIKYKPIDIIAVQGNSQTYSVVLRAENGDILHITRNNNYLVKVV